MTGPGRKIQAAVLSIGAAVAFLAMLGALPAAGRDASHAAITPSAPSQAMAWAPHGRSASRQARHIRNHRTRVAAMSRQGCLWPASPCDRQFVVILGIGF